MLHKRFRNGLFPGGLIKIPVGYSLNATKVGYL
jgi:hypothetical protein